MTEIGDLSFEKLVNRTGSAAIVRDGRVVNVTGPIVAKRYDGTCNHLTILDQNSGRNVEVLRKTVILID